MPVSTVTRAIALSIVLDQATSLWLGLAGSPNARAEFPALRNHASLALQALWEADHWPDLCPLEQRTPASGLIAYEQSGQTVVGEFLGCFDKDIRLIANQGYKNYGFVLSGAGAYPKSSATTVWLHSRLRCPLLIGAEYDATVSYAAGKQVYYTATDGTSDLWDVVTTTTIADTPVSAAAKFAQVKIPWIFRSALAYATAGLALIAEGKPQQGSLMLRAAEQAAGLPADVLFRQQMLAPAPLRKAA